MCSLASLTPPPPPQAGSPNPRLLVLGPCGPSASPPGLQEVAGRIPFQTGRLKPLGNLSIFNDSSEL